MKGVKLILVIMAAVLVTFGLGNVSYAFHDGGVAYCDGCHTMHNSSGNQPMMGSRGQGSKPSNPQFTGVAFLLQGSDQSSTCLNCHAGDASHGQDYQVINLLLGLARFTDIANAQVLPGFDRRPERLFSQSKLTGQRHLPARKGRMQVSRINCKTPIRS